MTRARCALLWLAFALTAVACSHQVGDSCMSSVDCDPNGTKSCDLSQPGGYCTIVGCDETTCPSEATCVRLFPQMYLAAGAVQCSPGADAGACGDGGTCLAGGYCKQCDPALEDIPVDGGIVQNNCLSDEVCLDTGLCAKQSYEQRECAKVCSSNGDCRAGYECRETGAEGSMPLAANPLATTKFCAPFVAPISTAP